MLGVPAVNPIHFCQNIDPLDMKGCICHFVKWQIHPIIYKGTIFLGSRENELPHHHQDVIGCGMVMTLYVRG